MPRAMRMVPIVCSDREVQRFVEQEMMMGPYSKGVTKTARQIFQEARDRFGDHRLLDFELPIH
jgi:hypothetical protein